MAESDPSCGVMACAFDEADRLAVIAAHDLPDATDPQLDTITAFAARLCDTSVALVSLVEEHRQRFIGNTGLAASETPRPTSFCAHAMLGAEILEVRDATTDPRFADNPLVTGAPHIRFYAGAPLVSEEGAPLGALCVIAPEARPEGLTDLQRQGLAVLAQSVMQRLADRRSERGMRRELQASEERFRILADAMPQMVWSTLPDGYHDYYNARWYAFTGTLPGSTDGEGWSGVFHPDDQDRAWTRWRHSLATGEPYEIEYRLRRHDGVYRWTLGRALPMRDESGAIARWFGTCTDIHDARTAAEHRELISNELSHRIKNIFAIVSGLIGASARHHPPFKDVARDLIGKVAALGRAHDFVRPRQDAATLERSHLQALLAELFAPYQTAQRQRIVLRGADPAIGASAVTPLALLFHELATNAVKYGALSNDHGGVTVTIGVHAESVTLDWVETGGPSIAVPTDEGFGSQLIAASAVKQLDAEVRREWRLEGLALTLWMPKRALDAVDAQRAA